MAYNDTYQDSQASNTVGGVTTTTYTRKYIRTTVNLYPGAHRLTYYGGGSDVGSFDDANAFIGKFAQDGSAKWITLLGGPNYTRCYGIKVDSSGNVYVCGRCGPDSETTVGAIQTDYAAGTFSAGYGYQNGFVAKLNSNGVLQWMTYIGTGDLCRDIALSPDETFVVVPLSYTGSGDHAGNAANCAGWGPAALTNAYMSAPTAHVCAGVVKLNTSDGSAVCATYLGGNADTGQEACVAIDSSNNIYLQVFTSATDLTVTSGCRSKAGAFVEFYVCKFSSNLQNLLWGTYLGGSNADIYNNTHNLALDASGNVFVTSAGACNNLPTTGGAYMETYPAGASVATGVFKLNQSNGALTACSYFGGNNGTCGPDGLKVDASGNVWFGFHATCTSISCSADAYQNSNNGLDDGGWAALDNDLENLVFASYIGGDDDEGVRSMHIKPDGTLALLIGSTDGGSSPEFPIANAYQSSYGGVPGGDPGYGAGSGDAFLVLFDMADNPVSIIFSTYLGGSHWDMGRDAFIDGAGNCYIAGGTHSDDFPTYDY